MHHVMSPFLNPGSPQARWFVATVNKCFKNKAALSISGLSPISDGGLTDFTQFMWGSLTSALYNSIDKCLLQKKCYGKDTLLSVERNIPDGVRRGTGPQSQTGAPHGQRSRVCVWVLRQVTRPYSAKGVPGF